MYPEQEIGEIGVLPAELLEKQINQSERTGERNRVSAREALPEPRHLPHL